MYARTEQSEINAFIESCLAIHLATRPNLFPVVKKFSNIILEIITNQDNKLKIINELRKSENFQNLKNELYVIADYDKKIFRGALGALDLKKPFDEIQPEDALNDIYNALIKPDANLLSIMPLHSVFGYRILRLLNPEGYNAASLKFSSFKKMLEEAKKFVIRKAEDKDIPVTKQLGVSIDEISHHLINEMIEIKEISETIRVLEHRNSYSRFMIKEEDKFQNFIKFDAPLVAGPSTHALSLFTAVYTYNSMLQISFTNEDLQEYALAYFAYLTTAGYHTFHEVMYSAATSLGLSYDMSGYLENIPKSNIKLHNESKEMLELSSEKLIEKNAEINYSHSIKPF